jgi:microcystin-dependent protein
MQQHNKRRINLNYGKETGMSDPFVGEIREVGFNFAPVGWLTCDGQLLPISQYNALFALLGTQFGGNGSTNFALPDLRGRVPIHPGQGPGLSLYVLGQQGGTENITLLSSQMPTHNHLVGVSNQPGAQFDPTNAVLAECNTGTPRDPKPTVNNFVTSSPTGTLLPATVSMAGGNAPHGNIEPYLCVTFIIATVGIFPSRP